MHLFILFIFIFMLIPFNHRDLSKTSIRDCSFEIREGGWTIWGEGHKISNIVFGGF